MFRQGEPGDRLYIVKSGVLEIVAARDGAESATLAYLGEGEVVGELALLTGATRSATARCPERAVILTEGDSIHQRHLNLSFRPQAPAASTPMAASPWDQIDLSGTLTDALRRVSAEAERRKIEAALRQAGGDKGRAADVLQLGYKVLLQKIKTHGIADS